MRDQNDSRRVWIELMEARLEVVVFVPVLRLRVGVCTGFHPQIKTSEMLFC